MERNNAVVMSKGLEIGQQGRIHKDLLETQWKYIR